MSYPVYEIAPEVAAPLVAELRGMIALLESEFDRMKRADQRYFLSMKQYSERKDLPQRIHEIKLIWMRRMVEEYLGE